MKLVIVESPTKARTLSRFLGEGYQLMASMGHLRDLPKKELGVDTEHDFRPTYIPVPAKNEVIVKLEAAAKKASQIILATDPDREGEAIAYHTAVICSGSKSKAKNDKFQRITFHEITKTAVEQALKSPGTINVKLVDAQQARRVLDRLVGYKLSPLLWRKVRIGLSAGRVQSPAVRLIVEREREIAAFKAEEFWLINAKLANKKNQQFLAKLIKANDKSVEVSNKDEAEEITGKLKKSKFTVVKVVSKEVRRSPAPPFITSTLQRTASSIFHWSAKKTMREAQILYETGLITYHRTDSFNLAEEAIGRVRNYIEKEFGKEYLPELARHFKTKSKLAQEAHEAIRPTRINAKPETRNSKFNKASEKLYKLIFNRFVACQMSDQVVQKNIADIKAGIYLLRAVGEQEKFSGWMKIYHKTKSQEENPLPLLSEKEELRLIKILAEQKFTTPAFRYSEGSLIKALEERGIGRPSTYASIVSTIQTRNYVEKIEGFFQPTPVGIAVNDFLVKYFSDVVDYDFSAEMEDDLDKIAQGKREWVPTIREFYQPFIRKLKEVEKTAKRAKIAVEKTGKKCPKCKKGEQVIRTGRFGKFLSCSRFPECDWKDSYQEKVKGVLCPKCHSDIVVRKTKKGRRFFGCSRWPECKWATWRLPSKEKDK
ncbi:MAG TPA: type I DNA topoisomerase [Candidatus Bathyarchaeia archaeon]|nr:type I DNA topoisomerase [Candidatus Bathyarchaeia archaeon]